MLASGNVRNTACWSCARGPSYLALDLPRHHHRYREAARKSVLFRKPLQKAAFAKEVVAGQYVGILPSPASGAFTPFR